MGAPVRHFTSQVNRPATVVPKDPAGARGGQPQKEDTMFLEPMLMGLGDKLSFYKKDGYGTILRNLWIENKHLVPRGGTYQITSLIGDVIDENLPDERAPGELGKISFLSPHMAFATSARYQKELLFDSSRLLTINEALSYQSGSRYLGYTPLNPLRPLLHFDRVQEPGDMWSASAVLSAGIYLGDLAVTFRIDDPNNKEMVFWEWRGAPAAMVPGNLVFNYKYVETNSVPYTHLRTIGPPGVGLFGPDPANELDEPPPFESYAQSGEWCVDWYLIDTITGQKRKIRTAPDREVTFVNFDTDAVNYAIIQSEGQPPLLLTNLDGSVDDVRIQEYGVAPSATAAAERSGPTIYIENEEVSATDFLTAFVYSHRLYYIKSDSRDIYYGQTSSFQGEFRVLPLSGVFTRSESRIIYGTEWSYVGTSSIGKKLVLVTDTGEVAIFSGDPEIDWLLESIIQIPRLLTGSESSIAKVEGQLFVATRVGVMELSEILKLSRNDSDTDTFRGRSVSRPIESRYLELADEVDKDLFRIKYAPALNGVILIFPNRAAGKAPILAFNIEYRAWFEWDSLPILDIEEFGDSTLAVGNLDFADIAEGEIPLDRAPYSGIYKLGDTGSDIGRQYRVTGAYPFVNTEELNIHVERVTPYIFTDIKDFKFKQDLVEVPDIDTPFTDVPVVQDTQSFYWPDTPLNLRNENGVLFDWGESWNGEVGRFDQIIAREEELRPAYKPGTALSLKFEFILNITRRPSVQIHGFLVRFKADAPTPGADLNLFLEKTR